MRRAETIGKPLDRAPLVDQAPLARAAWLALTCVAAVLTATAIARFVNGQASVDLAVFDQGLWAASRGQRPWSGIIGETLLEDHFGPGILLFVPLYRLLPTPIWLLLAQGTAAWASAFLITRRLTPSIGPRHSALVGAALLGSPPIAFAILSDFHSVVFAIPFALAAGFNLEDRRPRRALALGVIAGLFRVEVGAAVLVLFAVAPGSRQGRLRTASALFVYLLGALWLEKNLGHDSYWPVHYGHLGTSLTDALAHPLHVAGILLSPGNVLKALPWLATSFFLCLRRPKLTLPALVLALPVLLSRWPGTEKWYFQYGFAPTFLLVFAWLPLVRRRPERAICILTGCLGLAVLLGPLPSPVYPGQGRSIIPVYWESDTEMACIVADIPGDAGVAAGAGQLPLLAHRSHLYLWPYPFGPAPADTLAGPHLQEPMPSLANRVDYVIVPEPERGLVGPEFVEERRGAHYLRFRRAATTEHQPASCP